MLIIVVSVVLAMATLAGMAFLILSGSLLTVDGLFLALILGLMSAIFALNSLEALRRLRSLRVSGQPMKPASAGQAAVAGTVKPSGAAPASGPAQPDASATPATTSASAPPAVPTTPAPRSQKKARSVEGLRAGSVLVRNGTPVPGAVFARAYGHWKLVECESAAALERTLSCSGLTIFYPVGAVEGTGWAIVRKQAAAKALGSILSAAERQARNAVEIARVSAVNVLGLHHVTAIAYVRHVQKAAHFIEPAGTPQATQSPTPPQTLPALDSRGRAA